MRRTELVNSQHALSASCELIASCCPHGANANDDGVVFVNHGSIIKPVNRGNNPITVLDRVCEFDRLCESDG
jgi:hypothetical protein